ncbi:MAG: sodium/proline symporter PutP [Clostridia bacterium]|nr:sodium/proline symporter PutP [Clostridia bacterium]
MFNFELFAFILYFAIVLGIGVYFFFKTKSGGEKDYFLGGRSMGAWVSALSAGASDMSSWVLMGLPASILAAGLGQSWIAIGLAIGTSLSWLLLARKLRKYSIVAKDSITIPQFLTNRFLSDSKALQIVSALVFLVVYSVYAASSIKACGTLFNTVLGLDAKIAMYVAAGIILVYTFLGGFSAVCWTDFVQGLIMLAALMIAPIAAVFMMNAPSWTAEAPVVAEGYWSLFVTGKFDWTSIATIISGLGWGLGYFGMPHIIVRYMAIKSDAEVKRSRVIGISWTVIILICAVAVGLIGRVFLVDVADESHVFIEMVRRIFPGFIAGILLSAILAASMSTADSQLLAAASAFASDVYKPVIRKKASDTEMNWAGRIVVMAITIVAVFIASNPNSGTIMSLVENAWGAFGAAFGPVIVLALFWKRFTYKGALAGIIAGFAVDVLWLVFLTDAFKGVMLVDTQIYEIIPGFIFGAIAAFVVSLLDKKPSKEVLELCEKAKTQE